ncbi:MAG: DUF6442 family protein [Gemmataceae bacterium]
MNTTRVVHQDERTRAIENASYRLGYLVLSFGMLIVVAYRSYLYQQAPWDLMGLVILGGVVCTAYQVWHHGLSRRQVMVGIVVAVVAGLFAAVLAWWLAR